MLRYAERSHLAPSNHCAVSRNHSNGWRKDTNTTMKQYALARAESKKKLPGLRPRFGVSAPGGKRKHSLSLRDVRLERLRRGLSCLLGDPPRMLVTSAHGVSASFRRKPVDRTSASVVPEPATRRSALVRRQQSEHDIGGVDPSHRLVPRVCLYHAATNACRGSSPRPDHGGLEP